LAERDIRYWRQRRRLAIAMTVAGIVLACGQSWLGVSAWRRANRALAMARTLASLPAVASLPQAGSSGGGRLVLPAAAAASHRRDAYWHAAFGAGWLGLAVAWLFIARRAGRQLRRSGRCCLKCGYDLRGLPEPRCPECGMPFNPKEYPDLSAPRPERHSE